ncbi:MAG: helix-turn-helix domain-containing protein [Candidatus Bathyarchaeia archaeon]
MLMETMNKKLLLHDDGKTRKIKEITVFEDPQKLKLILNKLSWRILTLLSEREMYPLQIAKELRIHEQKVYYHVRKLVKAGAITVARQEGKKGAIAKYYKATSPAFGIELPYGYRAMGRVSPTLVSERVQKFFGEFIGKNGTFDGKIVVGSPLPHGPFKTSARDGHYASHLAFFLGQFARMPEDFAIKLDVDVKAEKEEKNNLILVGGPGTNLLTQELNDCLPIKFNMQPSEQGFLFGGLVSSKTRQVYTADNIGLVAKIVNPWDASKRVIVLAGNKAVGTKACVLGLTNFWKETLKEYKGEDTFAVVIQGFDLDGDGKVDSIEVLE